LVKNMSFREKLLMEEYKSRINKVMDYISGHLNDDVSSDRLAREAHFSTSHFHRIFLKVTGETVNQYICRVRLEYSANKLKNNPKMSITEIAYDLGFSCSACFARKFRKQFGMSATAYRYHELSEKSMNGKQESAFCKTNDKDSKEADISFYYNRNEINDLRRSIMKFTAEIKEMPEMNVVYIRHRGNYNQIGQAIEKIMKWATARDLVHFPATKLISVYHDDPNITEKDKLRSDACITVPIGTKIDGEVGSYIVPGGKFAVAHVEIGYDEFGEAWDRLVGEWIPENGYQSDDRMCYEICLNDPKQHPEGKFLVDICEPVKPL